LWFSIVMFYVSLPGGIFSDNLSWWPMFLITQTSRYGPICCYRWSEGWNVLKPQSSLHHEPCDNAQKTYAYINSKPNAYIYIYVYRYESFNTKQKITSFKLQTNTGHSDEWQHLTLEVLLGWFLKEGNANKLTIQAVDEMPCRNCFASCDSHGNNYININSEILFRILSGIYSDMRFVAIYLTDYHTFHLTSYLTYVLTFYLACYLTYIYTHKFWHAIWRFRWHLTRYLACVNNIYIYLYYIHIVILSDKLFGFLVDMLSGILSDSLPDVLSGIWHVIWHVCIYTYVANKYLHIVDLSDMLTGSLSDMPSGVLSDIPSDVWSGILSDMLPGIFSDILSDCYFGHARRI
jgi:hypothetical protein